MQQAVPAGQGGMAAILGLEDQKVKDICQQAAQGSVVEAVNFNSPGQVVIAGEVNAVTRATELAKEQGAKRALLLPVSVPSHCALMKPAAEKLAAVLDEIQINTPIYPVIHNVSVAVAEDAATIKQLLVQQLYSPVRWVETIQYFTQHDSKIIIECGPGKVLAGLTKRIDKTATGLPVFDQESLNKAVAILGEKE
jgi:[acyl-carrier-protein] S-malonyltransferase